MEFFYQNENEILTDTELIHFWHCVDLRGDLDSPWHYGLPTLDKQSLINYLTHVAFSVTAWHELVGTFIQYLLPPSLGMGFKLRPGREEHDVQVCCYCQNFE